MNLLGNSHRMILVFLLMFSAIVAIVPLSPVVKANSSGTGVAIPLYSYPGTTLSPTWAAVITAKTTSPSVPMLVVVNPSNGPGRHLDSNYVNGIHKLQSAGIVVVGYVYTNYGSRSIKTVEGDIKTYHSWYGVNGIFIDQMSNVPGHETYYSTLNSYVKSLGMTYTMGNPGTPVPASYIGTVDSIVVYENSGLPSLSTLSQDTSNGAKSNFAYIAYGVSSLDTSFETSSTSYVGWLYITSDTQPNPFDTLPPYFATLVSTLAV